MGPLRDWPAFCPGRIRFEIRHFVAEVARHDIHNGKMEVSMEKKSLALVLVGLACLCAPLAPALQSQAPKVPIPKPGVPEIMTMEAKFVRAAYNNEGYVIIGYQVNKRSIGEEWMLLEVGMTVREGCRSKT